MVAISVTRAPTHTLKYVLTLSLSTRISLSDPISEKVKIKLWVKRPLALKPPTEYENEATPVKTCTLMSSIKTCTRSTLSNKDCKLRGCAFGPNAGRFTISVCEPRDENINRARMIALTGSEMECSVFAFKCARRGST